MDRKHPKNIDRPNFRYSLLKKYVCLALTKFFYRRYSVTFDAPVPPDVPVVFAANHQNALIDALVILCATSRQPVFFARADIFRKKTIRKILTFLRIAPLFRIRDGRETMQQNSESFDMATGILSRRNAIGIFPEGTHNDKEQLIPLKKGLARMVLQTEHMHDFQLGIHVIPVSIAYLDYIKPRSEVKIHLGKPLLYTHYKELYATNPSQALVKFTDEFEAALKSIVIHVDNEESYVLIQNMRKSVIYEKLGSRSRRLRDSYTAAQEFINRFNALQKNEPDRSSEILKEASVYYSELEKLGISEPVLFRGSISIIASVLLGMFIAIGAPVYFTGRILNYLPFLLLYRFVNNKIADTQFRSSVYFAATVLLVAPILYIIQAVIAGLILSSWLWGLLAIPVMMLLGICAYQYLRVWRWAIFRWKANIFIRRNKEKAAEIMKLRSSLIKKLLEI